MTNSRFMHRFAAGLSAAVVLLVQFVGPAHAARPEHVPPGYQQVWEVQERHQNALIRRAGVVGVALGENEAGEPVLRIFTDRPFIPGLPSLLDDQLVEVIMTGRFQSGQVAAQLEAQAGASAPTDRWPRPIPIGVSVGHRDVTAGTIGCQVWQSGSCHVSIFILSNNHVLANSNLGVGADPILHPGPLDGGVLPADRIALLSDFEPVVISTTASNVMDAALGFVLEDSVGYETPPDGYGLPRASTVSATVNLAVRKYGRTTRMTTGRVVAINSVMMVDYPAGTAQFIDQIIILGDNSSPFSAGGDSGSLVVVASGSNARKTVGLVFAGSGNYSAANRIVPILQRFGVQISGD